jgi:hypothetical protein
MKIQRSTRSKKWLIGSTMLLIAAFILVLCLELSNTTHIFHEQSAQGFAKTPSVGGSSVNEQKGEPQTSKDSTTASSETTQPGDNKSNSTATSTTNLITPSGDFVSAHGTSEHPIPLSATLASVCNTTPGVSCKITFTAPDGTTKSLSSQLTDRGGSAYWNSWTPASIGLTTGSWQVKAVATSGSQTKTATDAMELVVSS